jgi:hypothetical protein
VNRFVDVNRADGHRWFSVQGDRLVPYWAYIVEGPRVSSRSGPTLGQLAVPMEDPSRHGLVIEFDRAKLPRAIKGVLGDECSQPPNAPNEPGRPVPVRREVCIYCSKRGLPSAYLNVFDHSYLPRGRLCQFCLRITVSA